MRLLMRTDMAFGRPWILGIAVTAAQKAALSEGFCPHCLVPLAGNHFRWCKECKASWPRSAAGRTDAT